jgi:hypothetical protein
MIYFVFFLALGPYMAIFKSRRRLPNVRARSIGAATFAERPCAFNRRDDACRTSVRVQSARRRLPNVRAHSIGASNFGIHTYVEILAYICTGCIAVLILLKNMGGQQFSYSESEILKICHT